MLPFIYVFFLLFIFYRFIVKIGHYVRVGCDKKEILPPPPLVHSKLLSVFLLPCPCLIPVSLKYPPPVTFGSFSLLQ